MLEGSGPALPDTAVDLCGDHTRIEPSAIAGLRGVQYRLIGRKQETIQQIQELRQQLALAEKLDADKPVSMEIGAITGEEGSIDNGGQVSHSTKTPDYLFFTDPYHEEIRISEEPKV